MTETCKGLAIITNHFKEEAVQPRIVYANKYLLNALGLKLNQVANQDPSKIFANWNSEKFIQEIIDCVDRKISWVGELEIFVNKKKTKTEKKRFTITPVYDINGGISYYSCTTNVKKCAKKEKEDNLICLDDFVNSLWEYQTHFKEIYELSPSNLFRIDLTGKITYLNRHAQEHFGLKVNDNLFSIISDDAKNIKNCFKDKKTIGKISKIDFSITLKNKSCDITCRFWPLVDEHTNICGYSLSISDITKKKDITKKLLELKGV